MSMSDLTRRDFLQVTAGAGAFASLVPPAARPAVDPAWQPPAVGAGWFDKPMRWVQRTLVENDPGSLDHKFWLDYFRQLHADAATLSAGGIVAYYPTDLPLHHRSQWLGGGGPVCGPVRRSQAPGDGDPFGELVRGCRALGMRVLARTDPHACRDDVHAAHPDWISTG